MRLRTQRGFTLIIALLLMTLFLVMGIGFLSQRRGQQEAVVAAREHLQAREIARTGLENAVAKIARRQSFPPLSESPVQRAFSYTEDVVDLAGSRIGQYTVTLFLEHASPPFSVMRMTSVGSSGPQGNPLARVTLHAELDTAANVRGVTPPVANPNRFRIFYMREEARYE